MARVRGRSLFAGQLRDEAADSGGMKRDGDAVGRDIDPLDRSRRIQPVISCVNDPSYRR